jgi:hypothetical protein
MCSLLTNVSEINGCTIKLLRHADGDTPWDIELNGDLVDMFGSFFATTKQRGWTNASLRDFHIEITGVRVRCAQANPNVSVSRNLCLIC